ncbi:MAG: hypothetical protein LGR52_09410, partial [Candidatus Thiosymbion ectosymbiont of Robbea hypermnestra]|nr:hypothetical protein [Candidatus Thiosymbion ectosymbiont of Robbea hypermnestra]
MKPTVLPADKSWPRRAHRNVLLFVLSGIAMAIVGGLILPRHGYGQTPAEQPAFAQSQANRPPIAATIFIEAVADEVLAIDIREHAHDPEGETPRLLGLGTPLAGKVERIDDYHFLYSAPSREPRDGFHYRIVDGSGARSEGWVFVTPDIIDSDKGRESRSAADRLLTEAQAKTALEARRRAEEEAQRQEEEIRDKAERAVRRWEEARREAKQKARRQEEAQRQAKEEAQRLAGTKRAEEKIHHFTEPAWAKRETGRPTEAELAATEQAEDEARRLAEAEQTEQEAQGLVEAERAEQEARRLAETEQAEQETRSLAEAEQTEEEGWCLGFFGRSLCFGGKTKEEPQRL